MRLARLWQQEGKRDEAHTLLAPVYDWCTERFHTAARTDARALLEAWASYDVGHYGVARSYPEPLPRQTLSVRAWHPTVRHHNRRSLLPDLP